MADNVYAKAHVDPSQDRVCLWTGANVMVEYSHKEAEQVLLQGGAAVIVQASRSASLPVATR